MELETQMFEAERAKLRQNWREKALKVDFSEAEEREQRAETEGEKYLWFLGEKVQKVKESWANHEVEVREMETKTNKALEELRVDILRLLPEEILYVLVRELMGMFDKLRDKEDSLGEVLKFMIQDKKEVTAVIEKIRDTQKRTDMQGWHKDGTTKIKIQV